MNNIFDKQRRIIYHELRQIGLEEQECWAEADIILEHISNLSGAQQITSNLNHFKADWLQEIARVINARRERMPLAYCLGEVEFADLMFQIVPGVLIPRSDTETLVEAVIDRLRRGALHAPAGTDVSLKPLRPLEATLSDERVGAAASRPRWNDDASPEHQNETSPLIRIAEIGVGSGTIAISLLKRLPECTVWACDISELAIHTTLGNARRHNVHERLTLVHGDWKKILPNNFDIIVSNPPYLPLSLQNNLQPEITFEPKTALFDGSEDGLSFYRQFAAQLPNHFANTGACNAPLQKNKPFAAFEIGDKQEQSVSNIFKQAGWQDSSIAQDINGLPRLLITSPPNTSPPRG